MVGGAAARIPGSSSAIATCQAIGDTMWPFHLHLGQASLEAVEILILAGVVLSALTARQMLVAQGIAQGRLLDLCLTVLVSGVVGAKLYYAVPSLALGVVEVGAPAW